MTPVILLQCILVSKDRGENRSLYWAQRPTRWLDNGKQSREMSDDMASEELRSTFLFAKVDALGISHLAQACRFRRVASGQPIVVEGEPGTTMFIILSGRVEVTRTDAAGNVLHLADREDGDSFGEMTLIDGAPRSATVRALETCRLLVLDRADVIAAIDRYPSIGIAMLEVLCGRLREADSRQMGRSSVRERLLNFLQQEAEIQTGSELERGTKLVLRVNRAEIGKRIGATRESVSREFASMVRCGALAVSGKNIVVVSVKKLSV